MSLRHFDFAKNGHWSVKYIRINPPSLALDLITDHLTRSPFRLHPYYYHLILFRDAACALKTIIFMTTRRMRNMTQSSLPLACYVGVTAVASLLLAGNFQIYLLTTHPWLLSCIHFERFFFRIINTFMKE